MRSRKLFASIVMFLIFTASLLIYGARAAAQTETVLSNFGVSVGEAPYGSVISDAAGNLYGTVGTAGAHSGGAVFELSPAAGGGWTQKTLFSFNPDGTSGSFPQAGLVFDSAGNLYGTATDSRNGSPYGTVYTLVPQADGSWTQTVLHEFGNGWDGQAPYSGLIFDAAGNLYGTTRDGGGHGSGMVFKLTPQANGKWTEKLLHSFGNGNDGQSPYAGLVLDSAGNLYGVTAGGGNYGYGTAFELSPTTGGGYSEKVLHEFGNSRSDGQNPYATLIFDAFGNLYGTTGGGGTAGQGTVFELSPKSGGGWTETLLYTFQENRTDGSAPVGSLIFDAAGNLYSTTRSHGANGSGTVFELTPTTSGPWTETILYNFFGESDGGTPLAGVILDTSGNIYGTTLSGGSGGTVFELTR